MIIARIESLIAGKPVSDALERAFAYVQAGADGIMIHSKNKSGEDIKNFVWRFENSMLMYLSWLCLLHMIIFMSLNCVIGV